MVISIENIKVSEMNPPVVKEHTHITKTDAKRLYFLSERHLEELEPLLKSNPHRPRTKMYLYDKTELMDMFKRVYEVTTSEEILAKQNELQEKKVRRSQARQHRIEDQKDQRRYDLVCALRQAGLSLRQDSKLCNGYIDGTIRDRTIPQIVRRMGEMRFLFDHPQFQECYEEAKEDYVDTFNEGYIPDVPVFEMAEHLLLQRIGGYPSVFAWQPK